MKRKLFLLFFFCFFSNCFAVNLISVFGGVSTPLKYEEQCYFINAPCMDIAYSYTFTNRIVLEADFSFFYQPENPNEQLLKNYMIDFTANVGYSFLLNHFSIVPQLFVGYAKYTFFDIPPRPLKVLKFPCYGVLVDFSYDLFDTYKIIIRPEYIVYGKNYLSPIKVLIGLGKCF